MSNIRWAQEGIVPGWGQISLAGYRIGKTSSMPLFLQQNTPHLRDDFTTVISKAGRHELKIGGEFLNLHTDVNWSSFRYGQIDANLRAVPTATLQPLFPVLNDPTTCNVLPLSPDTYAYHNGSSAILSSENQT